MNVGEGMLGSINRMHNLGDTLMAMGGEVTEMDAAMSVLNGLTSKYDNLLVALGAKGKDDLSLDVVKSRGCHGYIPDDHICPFYPYPLRIRAGDAYPKRIMRKGGEDIAILSEENCQIISDPYPRYESQDTGIYMVMRLPASEEFLLNEVDLSFRVPAIGGLMSEHLEATSGDPARHWWNRSSTRLDPIALLLECDTRFRTVILTSVYTNGGDAPRQRPLGRRNQMWI